MLREHRPAALRPSYDSCKAAALSRSESLHIHARVADAVFLPSGTFRPLPEAVLCEALHHKMLDCLFDERVLSTGLAHRMRQSRHSSFSVHNRIGSKDGTKGRITQSSPPLFREFEAWPCIDKT